MSEPVFLRRLGEFAARDPLRVALTFIEDDGTEVTLSFGELERESRRIAARLLSEAPDARRALVLHRPGPAFITALVACWMAGITAVPTYPPAFRLGSRASGRFDRLVVDADPQVVLVDAASMARAWQGASQGAGGRLPWIATDKPAPEGGPPARAAIHDPAQPAVFQYTSGSTGAPRGVMLTHANLEANLRTTAERFEVGPDSRIVSWLPPYHDMGLIGGVLPILAYGCQVVQMAPSSFISRPLRWLEAISRHRGTHSGGPNFAYELCALKIPEEDLARLDLSCWKNAFCGAETVRAHTLRRFAAMAGAAGFREGALMPCYGLAEATLMVTARLPRAGVATHALDEGQGKTVERVLCGPPARDVDVAIVDRQGRRCADGVAGEIWIAGAQVASGYWRQESDVFGQRLPGDERDWMRSGDVGYLHEGELVITGRAKDLVILRGRNLYPPDLEGVAGASHPALEPSAVAAFSVDDGHDEQLVLACEVRRDSRRTLDPAQVERAVQGALSDALDVRAGQVVLLRQGALPRTTSGKISRSATRAAWLAGELAPVVGEAAGAAAPERPAPEMPPWVEFVARIAGRPLDRFGMDWTLGELGIDSLRRVELALTLEQELELAAPVEALGPDLRLDQLAAMLVAQVPASDGAPPEVDAPCGPYPASPAQRAFLSADVESHVDFAEILCMRVPGTLDLTVLRAALAWLAQRHPALRLRFAQGTDGWQAHVRSGGEDDGGIAVERLDVAGVAAAGGKWRELMAQRVRAALDVHRGPLAHAIWFDRGALENGVLALAVHHLVVDAVSASILVASLQGAYQRIVAGKALLPARPDAYLDWLLARQRQAQDPQWVERELAYWTGMAATAAAAGGQAGAEPVAAPADARAVPVTSFALDAQTNHAFFKRYEDSAARHDALLAALTGAWAEVTGARAVQVHLEHHGRTACTGAPVSAVGWMVSFHPVWVRIESAQAQAHHAAVRAMLAGVPEQGAGYGLLRHGAAGPRAQATMAALPGPELGLVYRGAVDEGFRRNSLFPVLAVDRIGEAWHASRLRNRTLPPVDVQAAVRGGVLSCTFFHLPSLAGRGQVESLAVAMQGYLVRMLTH